MPLTKWPFSKPGNQRDRETKATIVASLVRRGRLIWAVGLFEAVGALHIYGAFDHVVDLTGLDGVTYN